MGKPSVSILIDTYHRGRFVEQASVSVRNEDFQISEKGAAIPAVTRVDRSAGPQTAGKRINPFYWRLNDEFEKQTGVPVLLNTGAYLRQEAIVDTPTDANRSLFSFAVDALALRSFLTEK